MDARKIDGADDKGAALSAAFEQLDADAPRPAKLEIDVSRDSPPEINEISLTMPGTSLSSSGKKVKLELKRNDDKRIEGTIRSLNAADKTARNGGYIDVQFALDVSADAD